MDHEDSTFRRLGRWTARALAAVSAALILTGIAVSGLVAVARHPYLLALYWFLGMAGLLVCAAACMYAFPGGDGEEGPSRPARSLACLAIAAAIALFFLGQGRPAVEADWAETAFVAVVLGLSVVLGVVGILVLSLPLILKGEPHLGELAAAQGVRWDWVTPAEEGPRADRLVA